MEAKTDDRKLRYDVASASAQGREKYTAKRGSSAGRRTYGSVNQSWQRSGVAADVLLSARVSRLRAAAAATARLPVLRKAQQPRRLAVEQLWRQRTR